MCKETGLPSLSSVFTFYPPQPSAWTAAVLTEFMASLTQTVFAADQPGVCNLLFVLTLASTWHSLNQGFLRQIKDIKSEQTVKLLSR